MTTHSDTKIKLLLSLHRPGTVLLAPWLETVGISRDLQKHYRRSGWLESVGRGALKRPGESITWQGGIYALQAQAGLPFHPGAMTALTLQGFAHYVRVNAEVTLFSPRGVKLPTWFTRHDWGTPVRHFATSMLPQDLGLVDHDEKNFVIRISGLERAMLECLHLAPREFDLVECFQVMEGLGGLRPAVVQQLLESCNSVKAKRLFLYMAERAGHAWLTYVDLGSIDLGSGVRSLAKAGTFVPDYQLVLPRELASP